MNDHLHIETERLIARTSLREHFHNSVGEALSHQGVEAAAETVYYIVNLLTAFHRSERFYEKTGDGMEMKPLAMIYAEALEGPNGDRRNRCLQRLGDVALFVAGVFSESLNRKVVDVDYYIAMGSSAYGYLSDAMRGSLKGDAFCEIFEELSSKFTDFVDALSVVNESASLNSNSDIMRLYELWVRTGSKRAAGRLRELGIEPSLAASSLTEQ